MNLNEALKLTQEEINKLSIDELNLIQNQVNRELNILKYIFPKKVESACDTVRNLLKIDDAKDK